MFTFKARDTGEVDRFRRAFPAMAARVVNRVAFSVSEEAKRTILRSYNVTADVLDANIVIAEAKPKEGAVLARVIAKGKRLPATLFLPQATAHGTSIEIRKGTRREIPGAFIAETAQGYGRRGGQSKKAVRRIIRNLRREKNPGLWMRRAESFEAQYSASTAKYRAMRTLMRGVGLTRAGVYVRKTKKRLPIREVSGTSVANLFSSGSVTQALRRFGGRAIQTELTAEMKDYQSRRA
jgi:hypothetical protein